MRTDIGDTDPRLLEMRQQAQTMRTGGPRLPAIGREQSGRVQACKRIWTISQANDLRNESRVMPKPGQTAADSTANAAHKTAVHKTAAHKAARQGLCLTLALLLGLTTTINSAFAVSGIRDAETEAMIRGYADPIIKAAGLDPDQIPIYILNDPSINAFVTPGNAMFLHTGLILQADRPLQVKGVIAHEMGHIYGNHTYRIREGGKAASVPILLGMLLGAAAIAAGSADAGIAAIQGGQHIGERTFLRFSREFEASADQAAITFMDKTGQSSLGLIEVTEKFRREVALSTRNANPYTQTHPLPPERIAALKSRALESPYADKQESQEELFTFALVQAKLRAFLSRPEQTLKYYPFHENNIPALYARAIAYYHYPDVERSLELTERLIELMPDYPYFYEFAGQLLFENGRAAQAMPYLKTAVELKPKEALFRVAYAQALLATEVREVTDEALDHLKVAVQMEPTNSFAWYLSAIAYDRQQDPGLANLATAERYYHIQRLGEAFVFAKQALPKLQKGTPQWQRAADIVQVTAQAGAEEALKRGRRPN